jgi:hypothetical protein
MAKRKNRRPVPRGLEQAVGKAAKHVDGRYCYGLPNYGLSVKIRLKLVALGDLELFEENEVDVDEWPDWIPFAQLREEPQFLAIRTTPPYPVGMWEHEDGTIHDVWGSFDEFVSKVIDKKDKTPFELMDKTLDKVAKLIEDDAYADALGLIEPAIQQLPKPTGGARFDDDGLARAYNLHGLALKGVKRWQEARVAFERSAEAGDTYAELNILDLLEDEQNPKGVIEYGLAARERRYFDDYGRIWVRRYLGHAYLDLGEPAKAEEELRGIVDDYAITAPDKVKDAREGLEKYIAAGRPGAAAAKPFLDWFKPKSYEVTPAQAAANRAWWDGLPPGMRAKLLEEIDKNDGAYDDGAYNDASSASDEDVARCLDVDGCHLDEDDGTFAELDAFLRMPRLERLAFYGDPDSIEPLRALPKLESLTINNDVIKDFAWPSRTDRDLWKAAEAGDRAGVERALAAGASVDSRGDHARTALTLAAGTHDIELCVMLVERGSDPWAGNQLEGDALGYFDDEGRAALERAAAKLGRWKPPSDDEPWRELDIERLARAASFDRPEGEFELEDGEPQAAAWPATVKFQMEAPKKDDKLFDLLRIKYSGMLVSERLAEVVRGLDGVELLPATLVDHARKPRPENYFVLNPLVCDCLVVDRCFPQWNHINRESISELGATVIDPAKAGSRQMFRLGRYNSHPVIVANGLARKLAGFTGVSLSHLKR